MPRHDALLWAYRCLVVLGSLALRRDLKALQLLGRQLHAYRRRIFSQVGARADNGPVVRAEHRRAVRGHPAERAPGLVPVLHLLGDHAKIEGDAQHDRVRVPEPPLPGRERLLKHPPRARGILGALMHGRELLCGQQNVRIILTEIGPAQSDGMLEHSARLTQIARIGEGLRTLPGGEERGQLRHAGHAARIDAPTPVRPGVIYRYVRSRGRVRMRGTAVYCSLLCSPPGQPIADANRRSARLGWAKQVRVAEWQTR